MPNSTLQLSTGLLWLGIKALGRKVKYKLLETLVSLLSAAIIFVLFLYIASDFSKFKLHHVSKNYSELMSYTLTWIFSCTAAIWSGLIIKKNFIPTSPFFKNWKSFGVDSKVIILSSTLTRVLFFLICFIPIELSVYHYLSPNLSFHFQSYFWLLNTSILGFVSKLDLFKCINPAPARVFLRFQSKFTHPITHLILWRYAQLFGLKNKNSLLILLGLLTLTTSPAIWNLIEPVSVLLALLGSLLCCLGVHFQFNQDLKLAWVEKQAGISHSQFYLSLLLSQTIMATLNTTIVLLSSSICLYLNHANYEIMSLLWMIPFIPSFIAPQLFFQIDHRQPIIFVLAIVLSSLFWLTAVYALSWMIFIFPLILIYGYQAQQDRYFRC